MPRTGPRRPTVSIRLAETGTGGSADIDRRALEEGLTIRGGEPNRSEMARVMLVYAAQHMPKGWRPPSGPPPVADPGIEPGTPPL